MRDFFHKIFARTTKTGLIKFTISTLQKHDEGEIGRKTSYTLSSDPSFVDGKRKRNNLPSCKPSQHLSQLSGRKQLTCIMITIIIIMQNREVQVTFKMVRLALWFLSYTTHTRAPIVLRRDSKFLQRAVSGRKYL